jgi:hypothetical protein
VNSHMIKLENHLALELDEYRAGHIELAMSVCPSVSPHDITREPRGLGIGRIQDWPCLFACPSVRLVLQD